MNDISESIAKEFNISTKVCSVLKDFYFKDNFKVPFICRYREDDIDFLSPEIVTGVIERFKEFEFLSLKKKQVLDKYNNSLNKESKNLINKAKSIGELKMIVSSYKNIEAQALNIAKSLKIDAILDCLLSKEKWHLVTENALSPLLSKLRPHPKSKLLYFLQLLIIEKITIYLMSLDNSKLLSKAKIVSSVKNKKFDTESIFKVYYNYSIPVETLQSHQILALNRAKKKSILQLDLKLPKSDLSNINASIRKLFKELLNAETPYFAKGELSNLLEESIEKAWSDYIIPAQLKKIRAELNAKAVKEAIECFKENLKSLLLVTDYRINDGKSLLSLDPGYSHGCKFAVLNLNGMPKETGIIPLISHLNQDKQRLTELFNKHNVEAIALGDGVGFRESANEILKLMNKNKLTRAPVFKIREAGVSIWSITDEAQKEFKSFTCQIRSAISIGRRLLTPLYEYTKADPKTLGLGLYQHDMPQEQLQEALASTFELCVSFVGLDLNTAPFHVIARIAGLNEEIAKKIVDYRIKNDGFKNREQLKEIPGITPQVFQQCAGFLKIYDGSNPLDTTSLHPEQYPLIARVLEISNLSLKNMFNKKFKDTLKAHTKEYIYKNLETEFNISKKGLKSVIRQLINEKPLQLEGFNSKEFECIKNISERRSLDNLHVNTKLLGTVANVTPFGVFVDIETDKHGLLHAAQTKFKVGDLVRVYVKSINRDSQKVSLSLEPISEGNKKEKTVGTDAKKKKGKTKV